jgi:hypothetical protein
VVFHSRSIEVVFQSTGTLPIADMNTEEAEKALKDWIEKQNMARDQEVSTFV